MDAPCTASRRACMFLVSIRTLKPWNEEALFRNVKLPETILFGTGRRLCVGSEEYSQIIKEGAVDVIHALFEECLCSSYCDLVGSIADTGRLAISFELCEDWERWFKRVWLSANGRCRRSLRFFLRTPWYCVACGRDVVKAASHRWFVLAFSSRHGSSDLRCLSEYGRLARDRVTALRGLNQETWIRSRVRRHGNLCPRGGG